jgi:hypothetical protein
MESKRLLRKSMVAILVTDCHGKALVAMKSMIPRGLWLPWQGNGCYKRQWLLFKSLVAMESQWLLCKSLVAMESQ